MILLWPILFLVKLEKFRKKGRKIIINKIKQPIIEEHKTEPIKFQVPTMQGKRNLLEIIPHNLHKE